jgi:hypothetical protein
VQREIEAHQKTELFALRQTIEKAEARGNDPLGDLARQLTQQIIERRASSFVSPGLQGFGLAAAGQGWAKTGWLSAIANHR